MKGTVKFFNEMKAFGFITAEDGQEVFVHQSALDEGVTLSEGDTVTFDIEKSDRGPKAVNVKKGDSAEVVEVNEDKKEDSDSVEAEAA